MSKIIIWVVIAVVVAGGGYFITTQKVNDNSASIATNTDKEQSTDNEMMTFTDFITGGGSYQCELNHYKKDTNQTETKSIAYIHSGMYRMDTTVIARKDDSTLIVLVRDGYSYMWGGNLETTGFKSKIVGDLGDLYAKDTTVATSSTGGVAKDSNGKIVGDYDCQPWTPDQSKFTIPTNIKFEEFNVSNALGVISDQIANNNEKYEGDSKEIKINEAQGKVELIDLRTKADQFYDNHGNTYSGFCASADLAVSRKNIERYEGKEFVCKNSNQEWAVGVKLPYSVNYWCVDSSGNMNSFSSSLPNSTVCPKKG